MKHLALLLLFGALLGRAEEITLTQSAILKVDRNIVSLKAGTVVELLSRDDKTLTIRFKKLTGTIPASSVDAGSPKPADPAPGAPPPPRKAETTYGKAVEKAKENAGKHEKNVVKPTDEVLQN